MHRLSGLDAQFLAAEGGNSGSQYCGVAIYQTGDEKPITAATMRERLAERMGQCPPLRWKLLTVPFGLDRPVFVDTAVNVGDHVGESTLASPATEATLAVEVAAILSRRLDRDKPLWRVQVIHGLPGRTAVVMTLHHAAVDGIRPPVNLIISNVPGSPVKLTCHGASLLAHYPMSLVFDGFTLNITVVSYDDGLDIGIVGDAETLPDAWDLMNDIRLELVELAAIASMEREADR